MTLEGKAKAYDEALEKAKFYHGNCPSEPERKKLEKMFPVLRESEDEIIRKAIVGLIEELQRSDEYFAGVSLKDMLIYLEKQKEQNEITIEQVYEEFINPEKLKDAKTNKYIRAQLLWELMHNGIITEVDYQYLTDDKRKPWTSEEYRIAYQKGFDMSEQLKQKEQKPWSEEDEEIIYSLRSFLIQAEQSGRYGSIQIAQIEQCLNWLKALRPQSKDEIYKEKDEAFKLGKHQLAIEFMNYLDENRPEGKMSLSNSECEDIDKAFKENDWAKIIRYVEKYRPSWKPSEHQMNILKAVKEYVGRGSGYWGEGLGSLIEDLEKLI